MVKRRKVYLILRKLDTREKDAFFFETEKEKGKIEAFIACLRRVRRTQEKKFNFSCEGEKEKGTSVAYCVTAVQARKRDPRDLCFRKRKDVGSL